MDPRLSALDRPDLSKQNSLEGVAGSRRGVRWPGQDECLVLNLEPEPCGICLGAAALAGLLAQSWGPFQLKNASFSPQGHMEATRPLAEDQPSPGTNGCPHC